MPDNDFFSLVSKDITMLRNISTTRSSGSVRQMAYEPFFSSLHLNLLYWNQRKNITMELCLRNALQMTNWNILAMCTMYPNHNITRISRFCKEFKTLVYKWFSVKSRSQRSSAYWPSLRGDINTTGNAPYGVGNVQSFIRHQVTLLALIKWYEDHPRRDHFTSAIIVCGTLSFYVKC